MSKMSTDLFRHALNGPTMGTRWTALFHQGPEFDPVPLQLALQAAVDEVDAQMSSWKTESNLSRLNAGPVGEWLAAPNLLIDVLRLGLEIGRASGGAFDIGVGDVVMAWGFGPQAASTERIRAAMSVPRRPAHEVLELETGRMCKRAPITLDLNGIAKGYGVDRMIGTLLSFGITDGLVGIDGEMRTIGLRPDGKPWTIAIEQPDRQRRAPHSIIALQDAAIATSGDYRHWVNIGDRHLSHTMEPSRGGPLKSSPASVTVVTHSCAEADAWATALMVRGSLEGAELARNHNLDVLFIDHDGDHLRTTRVGRLFELRSDPARVA